MIKPFMPPDIAAASPAVQQHYLQVLAMGYGERWAEMVALQQPPRTQGTDRTFFEGKYNGQWLDDMPKRQANYILREARAAGIDTNGKFYMSGLADKRAWCDPEAWVSDVSDVRRVAKKRNLTVKGAINIEGHEEAPKPRDLNPKIARELARQEIAKNPKLSMKDAMAKVKEKHVPRWKKKA